VSRTLVHGVWQRYAVQPHRVEKFKLSNDPQFEEKVRDIVGLYLNPPDRALVLCVDEKSQIQALDRTAPLLPLRPGLPERQTHDYKRHGTTTLFAAFNILNGKVVGTCLPRHRAKEFVKFLNQLEKEVPPEQEVHLIMDNYSTHKSATVQRWLKPKKRRRFHFHFTPTSSSWLNQIERIRADHRPNDSPWHLPWCGRTGASNLSVAGPLEQPTPTVRLESHCRRHTGQGPPLQRGHCKKLSPDRRLVPHRQRVGA
jgi:transposase